MVKLSFTSYVFGLVNKTRDVFHLPICYMELLINSISLVASLKLNEINYIICWAQDGFIVNISL